MDDIDKIFEHQKMIVIPAHSGTYQDYVVGCFLERRDKLVGCRLAAIDESDGSIIAQRIEFHLIILPCGIANLSAQLAAIPIDYVSPPSTNEPRLVMTADEILLSGHGSIGILADQRTPILRRTYQGRRMKKNWVIGAQVSTTHSPLESLPVARVLKTVEQVSAVVKIDILVVGARESPEIFQSLSGPGRPVDQVFLWYNLLSDIDGMEDSDLVVNWRGERSTGWGGWNEKESEVAESFRFVCPNNPAARTKTLRRLHYLLSSYPFTGVFLDKIRFPSPANGLDEVLSCFCEHCSASAKVTGLDLDAVARLFEDRAFAVDLILTDNAADWLSRLTDGSPLVSRFLRFRMDSITGLVAEAHGLASGLSRRVSFDLFSPGLAPLVGQDYRALARFADWIKPMTYRIAEGPAGLRLEIPALAEGISRMFGLGESKISGWAARHIPGFDINTLEETRRQAVPVSVISAEIEAAVQLADPVPVYFGLELVRHAGVVDITPQLVRDMIQAGRTAGPAGTFISWDLMHAPMDSIRALAAEL